MNSISNYVRRDPPTDRQLRLVAAALAYLVAALHLFHPSHGVGRFVAILAADPALLLIDPRPAAFILSAFAIITGVTLVLVGFPRKPVYALGMLLMVTYIVGYFGWHLSGHGGFLPGREPLYHGLEPHVAVVDHLRSDLWARMAIIAELLLLGLIGVLYIREP